MALSHADGWLRYPPLGGTEDLRSAYLGWLIRRFSASVSDLDVEPAPGAKQAIAITIAQAVSRARRRGIADPVVLLPNPFYPTYHAACAAVDVRIEWYLPDSVGSVRPIERALRKVGGDVCAVVVCNPGNPSGCCLTKDALISLSQRSLVGGATVIIDECYIESFFDHVPAGFLSVVGTFDGGADFLVLHSLSKRSGAAGLRSAFVTGSPKIVREYAGYNRTCGVSIPAPICTISAVLWRDQVHVDRMRSTLNRNWLLADEYLGSLKQYSRSQAGLFIWISVADDETVCRRLWKQYAVMAMPGRYLSAVDDQGFDPGANFIRIALVHEEPMMRAALVRLRQAL
ncbi:pyridoxal phosphate-dependent aminotransferase [Pseudomonas sp. S2_H01]